MKLLITGVSGLLGLNAALQLRDRYDIVGICHRHTVDVGGVRIERLDVSDATAVEACLADTRPDVVLHTAGLTNVEDCERQPALARVLNVGAATYVAASAARIGAQLIHISSDHLFDGSKAMRDEHARPRPLNVYAQTKADAEGAVVAACPTALVVRTNFFGWGSPIKASFSDWILASLRARLSLDMFSDVFFTPLLVNDLVDAVVALSERGASGVYHLAARERISKYAFGQAVARTFDLDASLIRPASVDGFAFSAQRPHDMSLASDKASAALGRPAPTAEQGIEHLLRFEQDGLPDRLAAAVGSRTERA